VLNGSVNFFGWIADYSLVVGFDNHMPLKLWVRSQ